MVEVVNMRTCNPSWGQPGDVRIDRKTKWGNPFPLPKESLFARTCVIAQDQMWFEQQEKEGKLDIGELIPAKRLGCWCKPKACHGDYIRKRLSALYNESRQVTIGENL